MAVRTELSLGTRLASYTVESVLGRGAMSVVYAAEDARLGRRVALKVLTPSIGESSRFRERFLRESRIAASIDHPNVIPIYEADEAGGVLYIAMRLVVGTDLRGLLAREGALAPERALKIVEQAASALDAAHAEGLLHRDVKPGNILLAADEHVYLSDFGLAVSGAAEGVLDGGSFHGTAEYAAPEQIEGWPEPRSDVYSLACVLFECLTGEPPFGRRRVLATLYAHVNEDPPTLSSRCSSCPEEADAVLADALAKEPAQRPATSGELVSRARAAFGLDRARSLLPRLALAALLAAAVAAALAFALRPGAAGPEGPTISTFAGTGERGSTGDGGPATSATLTEPWTVAVDAAGNVYVGEAASHRVRRIGRDGVIETVAGNGRPGHTGDGGPATAAEITAPQVAIGPDGDLYVLQHDRPALRRVDRRGVITTLVGTGDAGYLDDDVQTVSPDLCGRPLGPAFDPAGAVYIACPNANRVIRVERDGSFITVAGTGEAGYSGDGGPAVKAALHSPVGLAFDSRGNLYIAEELNNRVRKVDRHGIITTFAGTGGAGLSADGWRATAVDLRLPWDLAVDEQENVYILEYGANRIRKVDRRGFITTVVGTGRRGFSGDGGLAVDAELDGVVDFALDRDGNIYVADRDNQRVRKVTVAPG